MLLSDTVIDALRLRDTSVEDDLRKPRPSHQRRDYFKVVQQELTRAPERDIVGYLGHKADGFSGLLKYDVSKNSLELDYRTNNRRLMVRIPNADLYITDEVKACSPMLYAEACAMYVVGGEKKELGHAFVERAIAAFKKNGCKNKGWLWLSIRLFGVHSIKVHGFDRRTPTVAPFSLLKRLPVEGNNLIDVVPHMMVRISMVRGLWRFRDEKGGFLGADPDNFCNWAMGEARKKGTEGWVFKLPDHVFEFAESQKHSNGPTKPDGFGTDREYSSLKIREDFEGRYLFMKIENTMDGDKDIIWGYRKHKDLSLQAMVYAGDASKHDGIKRMLLWKTAAFRFSNPGEKKELRTIKYKDILASNSAVQVRCGSSGITHDGFVSGFKQYHVSKDARMEWDQLTETEAMASQNTHWMSTRAARIEYLREIEESEPDTEIAPFKGASSRGKKRAAKPSSSSEEEDNKTPPRSDSVTAWCRQETGGWEDKSSQRMKYLLMMAQEEEDHGGPDATQTLPSSDDEPAAMVTTQSRQQTLVYNEESPDDDDDKKEPLTRQVTHPWPPLKFKEPTTPPKIRPAHAKPPPPQIAKLPPPKPVVKRTKKKVFIDATVRFPEDGLQILRDDIMRLGGEIAEDEGTPGITIGVFTLFQHKFANGPGRIYFFLQDHPDAQITTPENVLDVMTRD